MVMAARPAAPLSRRSGAVADAGEGLLFLLLFAVRTGAGVFLVLAGRALFEVQVELLGDGLGTFLLADLHHGGEVVAFRDGFVADEHVAILGEAQLGRSRAVAKGDADDLLAWGDDFHVVVNEADFDLLVFVHEELDVGLDFGDELAAGGTGFGCMFVVVLVFVSGIDREGQGEGEEVVSSFFS
jgi:hypothetical protein